MSKPMPHEEVKAALSSARKKAEETRSQIEDAVKKIPKMFLKNRDDLVKAGHDMIDDIETMINIVESHEQRIKTLETYCVDHLLGESNAS